MRGEHALHTRALRLDSAQSVPKRLERGHGAERLRQRVTRGFRAANPLRRNFSGPPATARRTPVEVQVNLDEG